MSFYATTLSTNLLSTILLAYRIWSINRRAPGIRATKGPFRPVLSVVIDSGLLYSFTLVAALSCFASGSHGEFDIVKNKFAPMDSITLLTFWIKQITPIISIAFYMIMIRVGIAQNSNDSRLEIHSTLGGRSVGNHAGSTSDSPYPMNRMQVHTTKMTETNDISEYPWGGSKPKFSSETT
jgi:hypothetical protein